MLNICLPIFPQQSPRSVLTTMLQLEELSVMTMQNAWREMVLLHANARKELLVMAGLSARAVFQVQMYLNIWKLLVSYLSTASEEGYRQRLFSCSKWNYCVSLDVSRFSCMISTLLVNRCLPVCRVWQVQEKSFSLKVHSEGQNHNIARSSFSITGDRAE